MTMTGRFVNQGIRILAAVALLLAVMSAPILLTTASHTVPPPSSLPRKFAILKIGHSLPVAISARPCLREADSLQSEIEDELDADIEEDELTVTSPPASVSFDVLPAPALGPYPELFRFAIALAARPLRC